MTPDPDQPVNLADLRDRMHDALKRTASVLLRAEIPCALAGSYALWVHGAAEPEHDVDFVVVEDRVEDAARALAEAGFTVTRPPEGWLFKATTEGGVVVDLLHRLAGEVVRTELIDRSPVVEVLAVRMPVLSATDAVSGQLRAMNEHYCNLGAVLPGVRSVREQIDWPRLRVEVKDNPFAAAFLHLADSLGLTDPTPPGGDPQ